MALYFISYDLRNKRNYKELYEEFESFNAVQVLESTWCFNRDNTSAVKLRDYFKNFIDDDDALLLNESASWATLNTNGTPRDL
jgi:hypothetical protein|tara:strand:+ start:105588 stop:105836 length:249 start_codon:yes stop_codon:yes gene_type:complete